MINPAPQPSSDRLALLYHLSQTFNSSLDLDEVLNRVIDEVIVAIQAERGFVMLRDENGKLLFRAARGIDQRTINEPRFQISRSIVEKVATEGQPILTSDAQSDARFNMRQSVMILGLRSILCVPLIVKDSVLGVIYVDNRIQAGIFTQSDLDLLSAIASSAAIAIENARLYQVAVEKGRLERELQMARRMQASLMPESIPDVPGWQFFAHWQPAREVAGDFYDFIPVDEGRLGLVIADVTDKGMPAALFMALSRSLVRASVAHASSPAEGIANANRLICADSDTGMFVTLFYLQLEPQTGEVIYVNAGHNPPLYYSASRDELSTLTRTGMVMGIEIDAAYSQASLCLEPGDFILLYTDGITETFDDHNQIYGLDRLEQVVYDQRQSAPEDLVSAIEQSVLGFAGSKAPGDDITISVVRRL